jgi:plasmid stabilization system protein ParE
MDRKIIWTERASADIEAIVRYISRRDPQAAARIGIGIYDRAQIETRLFPTSLAATLAALPSMSPVPSAPFYFTIRKPEASWTN